MADLPERAARKQQSDSPEKSARKQRRRRGWAIAAVVLVLGCWGLWQIDMVRQKVRITYLSLTGGLWKIRGRLQTTMMSSPALRQTRQVIVYLPPGYDLPVNRTRRYPVLYLLHGFPDPGDGWVQFGIAPQLIDKAIVQQELPPMLIVMPDSHGAIGRFGDGEYMNAPVGGNQPGTQIATYVSHDVPAWADAHYRTIPSAAGRLIAGESTGGYGAVNLGLQHPDVFGTLISLSGYFAVDLTHFGSALWGPTPDKARVQAESPIDYVASGKPNPLWHDQFVYLGNGREDYSDVRKESERMSDVLKAAGIPNTYHVIEGHHSWDQWRMTLLDALDTVKPRLEAATTQANTPTATPSSGPALATPTAPSSPAKVDQKRL